jgi:transposase
MRAHAVLLSDRKYSVDRIADIYEVHRDSVSSWLEGWESDGRDSLDDDPRSGRPPRLNPQEKQVALDLVREEPRSARRVLALLAEATGKVISGETLKRLLKASGLVWKRVRRGLRGQRDEADFRAAQAELAELREEAASGAFDLYYYDEAGFTLQPSIPYAWQPAGETRELPCGHGPRLNVLAFFSQAHDFHPFVFEAAIDSAVVIECFEEFSNQIRKPTLVVIDQAPTHTSAEFERHLADWEKRGLYLYLLPAYSPELNLIEVLWRFIKYLWLPLGAYASFATLSKALDEVLCQIGSKYRITFA